MLFKLLLLLLKHCQLCITIMRRDDACRSWCGRRTSLMILRELCLHRVCVQLHRIRTSMSVGGARQSPAVEITQFARGQRVDCTDSYDLLGVSYGSAYSSYVSECTCGWKFMFGCCRWSSFVSFELRVCVSTWTLTQRFFS